MSKIENEGGVDYISNQEKNIATYINNLNIRLDTTKSFDGVSHEEILNNILTPLINLYQSRLSTSNNLLFIMNLLKVSDEDFNSDDLFKEMSNSDFEKFTSAQKLSDSFINSINIFLLLSCYLTDKNDPILKDISEIFQLIIDEDSVTEDIPQDAINEFNFSSIGSFNKKDSIIKAYRAYFKVISTSKKFASLIKTSQKISDKVNGITT